MLSLKEFKNFELRKNETQVIQGGIDIFQIKIHTDTGDYIHWFDSEGHSDITGPPVQPQGER